MKFINQKNINPKQTWRKNICYSKMTNQKITFYGKKTYVPNAVIFCFREHLCDK